jgi:hypothetical protein
MSPAPPVDPLEEALARPPHLDDAGFTDRVVSRLPPRRRARALALAAGGLASAGVAGLVLAGPLLPLVTALSACRVGTPLDLAAALLAAATPLATAALVLVAEPALGGDSPGSR